MKWFAALLCAAASAQVPYQRIVDAAKEPANWLTYSGSYQGHRYSPLTQITAANAALVVHFITARLKQYLQPKLDLPRIVGAGDLADTRWR